VIFEQGRKKKRKGGRPALYTWRGGEKKGGWPAGGNELPYKKGQVGASRFRKKRKKKRSEPGCIKCASKGEKKKKRTGQIRVWVIRSGEAKRRRGFSSPDRRGKGEGRFLPAQIIELSAMQKKKGTRLSLESQAPRICKSRRGRRRKQRGTLDKEGKGERPKTFLFFLTLARDG